MPNRGRAGRYLILLVPHAGLLATWDLAENLGATLAWFGLAVAALVWVRLSAPSPSVRWILGIAVALRLLLVPLPPTLSDDVFRYAWEGKVASSGFNPYELPPNSPELAFLRDDNWRKVAHGDVATVYPPLALTLFSIAASLPWPVLGWKLMMLAADLTACLFLLRLATARGVDSGRVTWYAWNPLVTVEIAGMGHLDALGVAAVVLAVWALEVKKGPGLAAFSAAAGILAKLMPLLALPGWFLASSRRWLFAALVAGTLAVSFGPVVAKSGGVPEGYRRFGASWEFNGPLYEPLWRGLERLDSQRRIESALDRRKELTGEHDYWNRFYPFNYARLHARLLLLPILLGLLVMAWRCRDVVAGTGRVFEAILLCSATVYPWYLLWLLPFAALRAHGPWLLLCATAFLSYLAQGARVPLMPWVFFACWGPYALARILSRRWSSA